MANTSYIPLKKAIERHTAIFRGHDRPPFENGKKYRIILHFCGGSIYDHSLQRYVRDERVQIYMQGNTPSTISESGYKMYKSLAEAKADFVL